MSTAKSVKPVQSWKVDTKGMLMIIKTNWLMSANITCLIPNKIQQISQFGKGNCKIDNTI